LAAAERNGLGVKSGEILLADAFEFAAGGQPGMDGIAKGAQVLCC
jgi:hypothetical protein